MTLQGAKDVRRFALYERRDSPSTPDGWENHQEFEYRVSWRLYTVKGKDYRDYRTCLEEWRQVATDLREILGPDGKSERWDFEYSYVFVFLRTIEDAIELKLKYEFPSD